MRGLVIKRTELYRVAEVGVLYSAVWKSLFAGSGVQGLSFSLFNSSGMNERGALTILSTLSILQEVEMQHCK